MPPWAGWKNFVPVAGVNGGVSQKVWRGIYLDAPPTRARRPLRTIATMADEQPATQPPAAETKDLHTDPVTGEKISKSELKRRQKQREKDEKKKEKEASLPARPKKEKKDDIEELNPNVRSPTWNFYATCC